MAWTITRLLKQWEPYAYDFGQENRNKKLAIVKQRVLFHKRNAEEVKQWYHRMLFVLAYPDDARMYRRAEFQLKHLGEDLKKGHAASCTEWVNSGLPYSVTNTRFSHQLLCWLAQQVDVEAEADVLEEDAWPLSEVLKPALPVLMKEICSTGLEGMELLDALKVKRGERLLFLLNHFSFIADSECRELLWDRIRLFVSLRSSSAEFSKAGNRLPFEHLFFSESLLKQFNTKDLLNTPLPAPESLSFLQASSIIQCVRYSLVLLNRETDPSTFMEEKSLRYYVLERGYSVALYGLTQERQLPLQVYVGYTLFRNGMPMAYGGAWVFGGHALFGLNIFEAYRGGESGYILCQLLRTYIQAFSLNEIEIDSYQFGNNNPEGIESGAYWFYYKYGFRSMDFRLRQLASKEVQKMQQRKGYRSTAATLTQLAAVNMRMQIRKTRMVPYERLHRKLAMEWREQKWMVHQRIPSRIAQDHWLKDDSDRMLWNQGVFDEVNLIQLRFQLTKKEELRVLNEMARCKASNPYSYNALLSQLLNWLDHEAI